MKSKITIVNKSSVRNKRCLYCKYYLSTKQLCINPLSINYQTQRFDYNTCRNFEWHYNTLDRNVIRVCELCKGIHIDNNKKVIPICLNLAKINNIQQQDYKSLWYLIVCNKSECINNYNV